MENHHHCAYCGNMISPSKKVCDSCSKIRQLEKIKSDAKGLTSTVEAITASEAIEEAIDEFIRKRGKSSSTTVRK